MARTATTRSGRETVTREAVLAAALGLFAERGYHGTSLKEVAHALDIRTPSLYNHMASKNDLLQVIVIETLTQVIAATAEALESVDDDSPTAQVEAFVDAYAYFHATHQHESVVVNQDATHLDEPARSVAQRMRREHEHEFRTLLERGQESGAFTIDSAKVASFSIREMCVSLARWFQASGPLSAEEVAGQYGRMALRMLAVSDAK